MIYVNITGGLGNQLFQYAFARSIQEKTGQQVTLSTYEVDLNKIRPFSLDKFRLKDDIFVTHEKLPWYVHRRNYVSKVLRKISANNFFLFWSKKNALVWHETEEIDLSNISLDANKDIYIGGYWQALKYISNIREKLVKEIVLKEEFQEKEMSRQIKSSDAVCVHVRRGDYVGTSYEVCSRDYYLTAIDEIKKQCPNAEFYFFSDDISWCKENFYKDENIFFVDNEWANYTELDLMMKCKYFIISNSTFSWWAQFLSDYERKIVIAPQNWHRRLNASSLYDEKWIVLNESASNYG